MATDNGIPAELPSGQVNYFGHVNLFQKVESAAVLYPRDTAIPLKAAASATVGFKKEVWRFASTGFPPPC